MRGANGLGLNAFELSTDVSELLKRDINRPLLWGAQFY